MSRSAPLPDLKKVAEAREADKASRAAEPGVAAPSPSPFSTTVEVLVPQCVLGKVGQVVDTNLARGAVRALIEAGAIRLAERPSVAEKKEANDG